MKNNTLTQQELDQFSEESFLGPYDLIKKEEIPNLLKDIKRKPLHIFDWDKSAFMIMPELYNIATTPLLLDKVKAILGEDVLLWCAQVIVKKPKLKHNWHVDVETRYSEGITVWIPLDNAFKSISVMKGSHNFNISPQELDKAGEADFFSDEDILREAKKLNPKAEIVVPEVEPGQFVIWNGPNWHAAINNTDKIRTVLIFQFSKPNKQIKMPANFELPDTKWKKIPVPTLLVSGKDDYKLNYILKKEQLGTFKLLLKYRIKALYSFYHTKNLLRPLYRKIRPIRNKI